MSNPKRVEAGAQMRAAWPKVLDAFRQMGQSFIRAGGAFRALQAAESRAEALMRADLERWENEGGSIR